MIRDYKFDTKGPRRSRNARARLLAAVAVLAATLGAVKYLNLNGDAGPAQPLAAAGSQSSALALPALDGRTTATPEERDPAAGDNALAAKALAATVPLPAPQDDTLSLPTDLTHSESGPLSVPVTATRPMQAVTDEPVTFAAPPLRWTQHVVARGESLAKIFDTQGLDASLLHRIVNSGNDAKSFSRIQPGQRLRFQFDENDELTRLELHRNRVESLRVAISDDAIDVEEVVKSVDTRVASSSGLIESSLFVDAQTAGLSDAKIMELAAIFGWDIDFALEIRAGDRFRVLYEEQYLNGEKLRDGPILAAEFTNRGETFRAVRYTDRTGDVGYYDDEGHSKRRAFLRTPIKFARISSRFNPKRWHPVLKRWRSHKGVDYAAPTGTPIRASGDGRVVFRGTKGGYGRTVILRHAGKYTTLYAHMSKYSKRARVGARVKQGQIIGYVGKTGLASGPHLHYEFRVAGAHKDPLRVKLPKSLALPKSEIAQFKSATQPLLARLDATASDTLVAAAEAAGRH